MVVLSKKTLWIGGALIGAVACADAGTGTTALPHEMTPSGMAGALAPSPTAGNGASSGIGGVGAAGAGGAGATPAAGAGGVGAMPAAGAAPIAGDDSGTPPMIGDHVNLAPAMSTPLTPEGATALTPAAPAGWGWYPIENTFCRDGSGNGIFVRFTDSDKLLIYLEGGGACTTKGFCHFNPANVNEVLTGDGQTVLGTALAVAPGRQQPGVYNNGVLDGIFSETNAANPFKGWNMVYVPYCTGDVHFGSNDAAMVPGVPEPQKMVGYKNTREFISHIVPTFKDKVDRVILTGASAGSFGSALNFSMVQDSFGSTRVDVILDSGAPFEDTHWPACLQQSWRDIFGLDESFPPDCEQCFQADGGGMLGLADFLLDKHPVSKVAAISSIHDEVIRLFFAPGQSNCSIIKTADPFEITVSQIVGGTIFPAAEYEAGLLGVRTKYGSTGRLASYLFAGPNETMHQHTFRARFYEPVVGGVSMAQFVTDFMNDEMSQVGP